MKRRGKGVQGEGEVEDAGGERESEIEDREDRKEMTKGVIRGGEKREYWKGSAEMGEGRGRKK